MRSILYIDTTIALEFVAKILAKVTETNHFIDHKL